MPTYNGWTVVTPPSTPWPASIEAEYDPKVSANENPFTGQQQIQNWNAQVQGISISLPPMVQSVGQAWIAFLKSCQGMSCVFQFAAGFAAAFPESLATDGTTQPYWRLKANKQKWSVKRASIYGLTFEVRQAI